MHAAAAVTGRRISIEGNVIVFDELEPVIVVADANASPEEACQVFFYGDYRYCGDAGGGSVLCCLGEPH